MFTRFVSDAVREIAAEAYAAETTEQNPVWMPQKPLRKMLMSVPASEESLVAHVQAELKVLFGFERRARRENLMVRWTPGKRRDRVDQILVRELHAEESSWTDFTDDQTLVKDNVSDAIMDLLIDDTVRALKKAFGA